MTDQEWMAVTLAITMMKGVQKYKDMGQLVKAQYETAHDVDRNEFISASLSEVDAAIQLLTSAKNKLEAGK
ncbi:hypothetical protein [Aeromonas sp. SCS5]|uniref:hypothetical protein n=1 Tax=Aeromonas sp. SCS5 TaxID=1519205 RepID=UPI000903282B|nr:hypothetical protein [Aeromonas sp. SCS5]